MLSATQVEAGMLDIRAMTAEDRLSLLRQVIAPIQRDLWTKEIVGPGVEELLSGMSNWYVPHSSLSEELSGHIGNYQQIDRQILRWPSDETHYLDNTNTVGKVFLGPLREEVNELFVYIMTLEGLADYKLFEAWSRPQRHAISLQIMDSSLHVLEPSCASYHEERAVLKDSFSAAYRHPKPMTEEMFSNGGPKNFAFGWVLAVQQVRWLGDIRPGLLRLFRPQLEEHCSKLVRFGEAFMNGDIPSYLDISTDTMHVCRLRVD